MTGKTVELGSRLGCSQILEPLPASPQDGRQAGDRFHVLNQRRLVPKTLLHRIGRLHSRHASLALQSFQQGRLFTTDVGAVPIDEVPAHGRIDQTPVPRLFESVLQSGLHLTELASHVGIDVLGLETVRGDGQPLDHQVGRRRITSRSLKVPGSPSSALSTM